MSIKFLVFLFAFRSGDYNIVRACALCLWECRWVSIYLYTIEEYMYIIHICTFLYKLYTYTIKCNIFGYAFNGPYMRRCIGRHSRQQKWSSGHFLGLGTTTYHIYFMSFFGCIYFMCDYMSLCWFIHMYMLFWWTKEMSITVADTFHQYNV